MSKYDKHFAEKHEIYIYKPKKLFLWHSIKCFITASSSTWVHVTVYLLRWNLGSVSVLNVIWPPETVVLHLQLLTAPLSLCLLIDKKWKLKDFLLFLRCCTTFHQPIHFLPTRLLFTPRPVTDKYSIKKLHQCTTMKQQHPVVRCNPSCQKLARLQEKCNSFYVSTLNTFQMLRQDTASLILLISCRCHYLIWHRHQEVDPTCILAYIA